jgi:hypothetical protein
MKENILKTALPGSEATTDDYQNVSLVACGASNSRDRETLRIASEGAETQHRIAKQVATLSRLYSVTE